MQFIREDAFHKVVSITGPRHNLLALEFGGESAGSPVRISSLGPDRESKLNPDVVLLEVLAGVAEANQEFGTNFNVDTIQYVSDDIPPESAYRLLAFKIVERLAKNLSFQSVAAPK